MKQIKLLAVGNSFTQDSLAYLHDICAAGGVDLKAVNLYIGGCSLERHWKNMEENEASYLYEVNGVSQEKYVSSREILEAEEWDYILTQQASHDSGMPETYDPWLHRLLAAFRDACPGAECLLQKTWAYEIDSEHNEFSRYHNSQQEMYTRLSKCYEDAAAAEGVRLIPSADVIQAVRKEAPFRYELGERSLCKDGYHMDLIYGRYLLGAVFYEFLTGRDIRANGFLPEGAKQQPADVIRECVHRMVGTDTACES